MTKFFVASALTLLLMNPIARAQDNNPLINSGQIFEQAGKLYDSGQIQKAISYYRQIDRNDTNYVRALYSISDCYFRDSQFSVAMDYAKKALATGIYPEIEPDLYNQIGNDLSEAMACEQAIKIYDSAIRKYPYFSLLYLNKGTALIKLARYAEAEAVFKKALVLDPFSFSCHYKLGICAVNQGKLVPAFLSFIGYLMVSPEGKFRSNAIAWLGIIANNTDTIQALTNHRKEDPDENYASLEQILQSKIALDKNYKPLIQLDDPISRQIQVVLEKMEYMPGDSDFWMQYYVPWFKDLYTSGRFEPFVNRLFSSVNIPLIQDYIKKHKKEMDAVLDNASDYLHNLRITQQLTFNQRSTDSLFFSVSNGNISARGLYLKKADKPIGPRNFVYPAGNIRGTGTYNADGKEEGDFTWYFYNGKVKGKEFYRNGKQEGEETYYFSNGQRSSHSWYQNNQLEGEKTEYFWVGIPNAITHYHAGKEDGVKITFYANGDTSMVQNYSAGVLDGDTKTWTRQRTLEVADHYKAGERDGLYQKYYPNGQLEQQGSYIAGKQEGEWKSWYANGQLKTVGIFVKDNGEGEFREYYESGVLNETYTLKNGKMSGDATYYDEDTKRFSVFHYSNGNLQKAQYFDKQGKLIGESDHDGKAINLVEYLPDGSKRIQTSYNDKDNIDGVQTSYYQSGKIMQTTAYKNGDEDGANTSYFPNGNKKSETWYAGGKMDGYHRIWFNHGQIQEEGWYKEDQGQGYWLYHDEQGALTDSIYYYDDNMHGYKTSYAPDGKKNFEYKYHSGWLEELIEYDSTGKILGDFQLPAGTGTLHLIYPDGKPWIEEEYRGSYLTGTRKVWYCDGKPSLVEHFTRGMQDSTYTSWFHSGGVSIQGQYVYGEKAGDWKYYALDGHIRQRETYVRGNLNGDQNQYYSNGKLEHVTPYRDGRKEGVAKSFDPDGTLLFQITYLHDDPVSYSYLNKQDSLLPEIPILLQSAKVKTFFPNGKTSAEFEFKDGYIDGDYRLYFTNGQLRYSDHRNYGVLEGGFVAYYPGGQIQDKGTYLHDNLQGLDQEYNEKGRLTDEFNYYNGMTNGIGKLFDENGRVQETDYYYYGNLISVKK